ncbi:hypothetical protein KY362_05005 [Candidatus Woesearchaeota archaeon]|nr:hypothetical protein [Candidatus Woesearchaeota archaeon]
MSEQNKSDTSDNNAGREDRHTPPMPPPMTPQQRRSATPPPPATPAPTNGSGNTAAYAGNSGTAPDMAKAAFAKLRQDAEETAKQNPSPLEKALATASPVPPPPGQPLHIASEQDASGKQGADRTKQYSADDINELAGQGLVPGTAPGKSKLDKDWMPDAGKKGPVKVAELKRPKAKQPGPPPPPAAALTKKKQSGTYAGSNDKGPAYSGPDSGAKTMAGHRGAPFAQGSLPPPILGADDGEHIHDIDDLADEVIAKTTGADPSAAGIPAQQPAPKGMPPIPKGQGPYTGGPSGTPAKQRPKPRYTNGGQAPAQGANIPPQQNPPASAQQAGAGAPPAGANPPGGQPPAGNPPAGANPPTGANPPGGNPSPGTPPADPKKGKKRRAPKYTQGSPGGNGPGGNGPGGNGGRVAPLARPPKYRYIFGGVALGFGLGAGGLFLSERLAATYGNEESREFVYSTVMGRSDETADLHTKVAEARQVRDDSVRELGVCQDANDNIYNNLKSSLGTTEDPEGGIETLIADVDELRSEANNLRAFKTRALDPDTGWEAYKTKAGGNTAELANLRDYKTRAEDSDEGWEAYKTKAGGFEAELGNLRTENERLTGEIAAYTSGGKAPAKCPEPVTCPEPVKCPATGTTVASAEGSGSGAKTTDSERRSSDGGSRPAKRPGTKRPRQGDRSGDYVPPRVVSRTASYRPQVSLSDVLDGNYEGAGIGRVTSPPARPSGRGGDTPYETRGE